MKNRNFDKNKKDRSDFRGNDFRKKREHGKDDRPGRGGRSGGDRNERGDRNDRNDRNDRGSRSDRSERGERGGYGGHGKKPRDRDRPYDRERPQGEKRAGQHGGKYGGQRDGQRDGKRDGRRDDQRHKPRRHNAERHGGSRQQGGDKMYGNPRGHAREKFKGEATLWGIHAVTEAWKNPARKIKKFYATENALAEFAPVMHAYSVDRPQPVMVERRQIDDILPPGAVHQGLAIDAAPLEEMFVQDLVIRAAGKERSVMVVLDQVTDPHNVGAVMRSACAFGADGLIMQSRHAPEINGTLAKAASGAVEHIPVAYETNLSRAINHLQESGYAAVALDERGETNIASYDFPAKIVIVMGAEGKGLRQGLRENCDAIVHLPTGGPIGTLNVSNAAAVTLYAWAASNKA